MAKLSKTLFNEVVAEILLHVQTPQERISLIEMAFRGSPLKDQIDPSGTPRNFTIQLVQKSEVFGQIELGEDAVIALLREIQNLVGEKEKIEKLIEKVSQSISDSNQPASLPVQKPKTEHSDKPTSQPEFKSGWVSTIQEEEQENEIYLESLEDDEFREEIVSKLVQALLDIHDGETYKEFTYGVFRVWVGRADLHSSFSFYFEVDSWCKKYKNELVSMGFNLRAMRKDIPLTQDTYTLEKIAEQLFDFQDQVLKERTSDVSYN